MRSGRDVTSASSVIVLRPAALGGFEVLLTRCGEPTTAPRDSFGCPTGVVAQADFQEAMLRRCRGMAAEAAQEIIGAHISPARALGFWIAAMRVLFEEVGILLSVGQDGKRIGVNNPAYCTTLGEPQSLPQESVGFRALLEAADLFGDAARLAYFSHWQWSESSDPPLDARFFLTRLARNDFSGSFSREPQGSLWITPDRALHLCQQNQIRLSFPIFASLRTLADFDSIDAISAQYRLV